jgi:hypothetical protein
MVRLLRSTGQAVVKGLPVVFLAFAREADGRLREAPIAGIRRNGLGSDVAYSKFVDSL